MVPKVLHVHAKSIKKWGLHKSDVDTHGFHFLSKLFLNTEPICLQYINITFRSVIGQAIALHALSYS